MKLYFIFYLFQSIFQSMYFALLSAVLIASKGSEWLAPSVTTLLTLGCQKEITQHSVIKGNISHSFFFSHHSLSLLLLLGFVKQYSLFDENNPCKYHR